MAAYSFSWYVQPFLHFRARDPKCPWYTVEAVAIAAAAPAGQVWVTSGCQTCRRWVACRGRARNCDSRPQEGEGDRGTAIAVSVPAISLLLLSQILLHRYVRAGRSGNSCGLIMSPTFWILSTEAGFRALSWSIRTGCLFPQGRGVPTILPSSGGC
jgi:hypothetical protein